MRTLPPDYNDWLKASGLDPVERDIEEEYDDQWMIKHFSKYSVELGSQNKEKVETKSPAPGELGLQKEDKVMAKDGVRSYSRRRVSPQRS